MKTQINKFFNEKELLKYGDFYKLNTVYEKRINLNSNLILVTAITPTVSGEGKTTTAIGLNDTFNYFKHKSLAVLRQPSMGPYFGLKGGATGSGKCSLINANLINSGFTGDFYEIEAANNLVSATIDNEVYFDSELKIDPNNIIWKRCIDVNDRSLRQIQYTIKDKNIKSSFTITAASSLMALFCLAKNKNDLTNKIKNTIVAFNKKKQPVKISDLKITKAVTDILANAIKPNLAFSLYGNPVIMHGGPFANIAHGTSSLISLIYGLNKADYVFTEAGFGSDLGAEKFVNILCRISNLAPNLVVLTITLKAVKSFGIQYIKLNEIKNVKNEYQIIDYGFKNVIKHFNIIKNFNLKSVIIINKFEIDDKNELNYLLKKCLTLTACEIATMWKNGPSKNEKLIKLIKDNLVTNVKIKYTYKLNDSATNKIKLITNKIYNGKSIKYEKTALNKLKQYGKWVDNYFICCAKTQYAIGTELTHNDDQYHDLVVSDIDFNFAANFIIPIFSKMFLMPGLPKIPNAKKFED